jgi:hypothetical protein
MRYLEKAEGQYVFFPESPQHGGAAQLQIHLREAGIISLGVYGDGVLGDIVDVQVLHRRDLDFCWVHLGGIVLRALSRSVRRMEEWR